MQRLSSLVDIFFRGSDFGYNSIIQSLANTHLSIAQGVAFHTVCFAHKFFSIHIWHVHACYLFSLFAVALFGTPARLLHVCLGSVVLALFLRSFFVFHEFDYKFQMDTASEFDYALDSFTPIC